MTEGISKVLRRNFSQALRARRLGEAADLLERLKLEDAMAKETRACELELAIETGKLDSAAGLCRQLLELYPASPRVLFLAGRLAYRRREYEQAARHFRESGRARPHTASTRWLGKALTELERFDEAEALLVGLAAEDTLVRRDLAWLYERSGDAARALVALDAYLDERPNDPLARAQRVRLSARAMDAAEIEEEVSALLDLGEKLSVDTLDCYLETLLSRGRGAEARELVRQRLPEMGAQVAHRLGWTAHRLQAHDLVVELFVVALSLRGAADYKLTATLEAAALKAGRVPEVVEAYRRRCPDDPRFHGKIRSLERRAESAAPSGERSRGPRRP